MKKIRDHGFTLIELLVVIAVIGILAVIIIASLANSRQSARVAAAGQQQRQFAKAVELYYADMGFYPPDVNRGWDPGFSSPLPTNPDQGTSDPPTGPYAVPGTNCAHCPSDWQDILATNWRGPYLPTWPRYTPWQGKYDYNYWAAPANRPGGCVVPAGIWIGVEAHYDETRGAIPPEAEQIMMNQNSDGDGCINGEALLKLQSL